MESQKRDIPPKPIAAAAAADARLKAKAPLKCTSLIKHNSWSPDILREEVWSRQRRQQKLRDSHRRGRSVTDDDLNELKACFELGFRFDSPESDPKLCNTFPALEMFNTINKQYSRSLSRSSSSSWTTVTDCESPPSTDAEEPSKTIFDSGDDNPKKMKARLRQWAQLVACTVRQSSRNGSNICIDNE